MTIKSRKIEGTLYSRPEDFLVFEMDKNGAWDSTDPARLVKLRASAGGNYVGLTLVKKGISTFESIAELARFMEISVKEIGYCGLKDTFGLTSQKISLPKQDYLRNEKRLMQHKFSSFFIKNPTIIKAPYVVRSLWGNRFAINLSDLISSRAACRKLLEGLKKSIPRIPNYYGPQRFGVSQDNHLIGRALLKRKYLSALKTYLTHTTNEPASIQKVRRNILSHWGDWEYCYRLAASSKETFAESRVLDHLRKHPADYLGALDQSYLLEFFINSFNSYLYNKLLKRLIRLGYTDFEELPMPGYDSVIKDKRIKKILFSLLAEEGITLSMYKNQENEKLSCKGRNRKAWYSVRNFEYSFAGDNLLLHFELPTGAYASLFLNIFIKNRGNNDKIN